ncbi:hypothetical protein CB0940_03698 [Cercospora beticola]|uniref:Uncharacterized protein n=1 Tax=Cercospora beticola TaxID=122368 RepID=A0A2G5I302_CERBT|nr:hypothetical protein CB0940_03698 [Cercospora beticola]PIA99196.1 hypothetical protein CB0940_03698 [Cercospora beticola]WPB00880.1 hypothetical protein RHO25_005500 [Cercospora beticola]
MAASPDKPPSADKPPTMPSAFLIPELLENIIMHLPLRDILLCQRVGTQFRNLVQGSSTIKKTLFLEPATSDMAELCFGVPSNFRNTIVKHVRIEHWKTSTKGEIVWPLLNPFLVSQFETEKRAWKFAALDVLASPPFDAEVRPLMKLDSSFFDSHESRAADTEDSGASTAPQLTAKSLPPMLITHPPSRSLTAWERPDNIVEDTADEYSRVGVRFDALLKAASTERTAVERIFLPRGTDLAGAYHWRVLPESALDRVTGWEMLAVLNKTDPKDMREEIDRIIKALKKWDYVVDGKSDADGQTETFAWEVEDVEQDSLFETVTVGSGPW